MTLAPNVRSGRTFRRGHESWRRGDLEEAERFLREALRLPSGSTGALLYLARVQSERGDLPGARDTLNEARAAGANAEVAEVFERLLSYDHDSPWVASEASPPRGAPNLLTRSIESLVDLRGRLPEGPEDLNASPLEARLPLAARWIAEITGRALALVDRALHVRDREAWVRLHHDLLAETYLGVEPGSEPEPASGKNWSDEVVEAFVRRDYPKVDGLFRGGDVPPDGAPPTLLVCRTFSLLAMGKLAEALRTAETVGKDPTCGPDASFLEGLGHAAAGRIGSAGWCFARAARYRDIEVDQVFQRVSAALPIRWTFDDD